MPITLRTRPVCHYCGQRNKPANKQRFACQHCLAENFLDEHGEIVDVPSEVSSTPRRFATTREVHYDTTGSIFCATCLKNQAMYTAALAEFLPDPDDEEYERFEAALPEFKKRMDKQFPQCCPRCEPKVRAQLQQASYNARTDHLRRVLEKTKAKRVSNRLGGRSLLVSLAGLGYLSSVALQLLWHILGSQSVPVVVSLRPVECLSRWPIPVSCADYVERHLWFSFILGLICIWWNPKWQAKLQGRADRLVGLSHFYRAQVVLLALRFVAWLLIKDVPFSQQYQRELHSVSLGLIVLVSLYTTHGIVQVDKTPLVNWHQDPTQLLTAGQFENPVQYPSPSTTQVTKFPLENLESAPQQAYQPWRPPAPPNEADADAMDWVPSSAAFEPQLRQINRRYEGPSPFYGTLPQVPKSSVFASRSQPVIPQKPIGIPMGFFDKTSQAGKDDESEPQAFMAQPKFFPRDDRADTGLESIFGKVFSLHDEAPETRIEQACTQNETSIYDRPIAAKSPVCANRGGMYYKAFSAFSIIMLLCFTAYGMSLGFFRILDTDRMITFLLGCILILGAKTVYGICIGTEVACLIPWNLEATGMAVLAVRVPASQSTLFPLWHKLVVASFSIMLVQEVYEFCTDNYWTSRLRNTPSENSPIQSMKTTALKSELQPQPSSTHFAMTRRDSISSIASDSSINTTSTASGWKTPVVNHRQDLVDPSTTPSRSRRSSQQSNNTLGIASLGLNDFSVGTSVAGPRLSKSSATTRKFR